MGAVVAIVALIGISATGATYFGLSGRVKSSRQALDAAQADQKTLGDRMAAAEARLAALTSERDDLERTHKAATKELDDERRCREQAEGEAQNLRSQLEERESPEGDPEHADAAADAADDDPAAGSTYPEADGCWALLLADVTRRWAAVVGAPPELRGVHLGAVPDQLTEALTRDIDRLREEVGVDISFRAGATIEPADPVVFLLAATHLLGELAAGCQRVTVELDGALVLTGDEWIGPFDDLELARERTLAAGALINSMSIEETTPEPVDDSGDGEENEDPSEMDGQGKPTFRVSLAMQPTA